MPPDRLVLAFDTSAAHCAAALLCDDQILAEHHEVMQKGQAEKLFPILQNLLQETGKAWKDLDCIAVGIGPGNFTGIRISVAAARGLALSLDIPAVGVSTFDASSHDLPRPVSAIVDARGGQSYVQSFSNRGAQEPFLADAEIFSTWSRGQTVVGYHGREMAQRYGLDIVEPYFSLAVAIGLVAQAKDPVECERPAPMYLKSADANPPKQAAPIILS